MDNQILDDPLPLEESEVVLVEASLRRRFANLLLDYFGILLFVFVIAAVGLLVGLVNSADLERDTFANLLGYVSMLVYYVLFEYFLKGKTLGKFITRTRVVTLDGEHPSLLNIIGRTLCRFIPLEPFSFLGNSLSGWHDRISKTMVIDERESRLPNQNSDFV